MSNHDEIISEVRDHDRRRRRASSFASFGLGLAIGLGAFAVSAVTTGLADGASQDATSELPDPPWNEASDPNETPVSRTDGAPVLEPLGRFDSPEFGTPHVSGRDSVASWHDYRFGWVYVYDDGTVLSYTDGLHPVSRNGEPMSGVISQRLTPYGLELVLAGVLDPRTLLVTPLESGTGIWSDAPPEAYDPNSYAMCPVHGVGETLLIGSVSDLEGRLARPLQSLTEGTEQAYLDANMGDPGVVGEPGRGPVECFALNTGGAAQAWMHGNDRDRGAEDSTERSMNGPSHFSLTSTDGEEVEFVLLPLLPHGGWVYWGR